MSPTGTGEGSQVFYMMLGLNTVLVKTMLGSGLHYWNGISFEQPKHFKLNDIRQQSKLVPYPINSPYNTGFAKNFGKCNIAYP
jgi:hypothetical protein